MQKNNQKKKDQTFRMFGQQHAIKAFIANSYPVIKCPLCCPAPLETDPSSALLTCLRRVSDLFPAHHHIHQKIVGGKDILTTLILLLTLRIFLIQCIEVVNWYVREQDKYWHNVCNKIQINLNCRNGKWERPLDVQKFTI